MTASIGLLLTTGTLHDIALKAMVEMSMMTKTTLSVLVEAHVQVGSNHENFALTIRHACRPRQRPGTQCSVLG